MTDPAPQRPADSVAQPTAEGSDGTAYSLMQLVGYFLRLGTIGFGGPVALVGYMHRDLVERRRWITEADFKEGMTLAQLMPGPLAAQLGIYIGYVHYRVLGATLAGLAFVLPSFLMVLGLGWAYVRYEGLPWMRIAFYGVGASVIAIIALSGYKLVRRSIGRDPLLIAIGTVSGLVTAITETEYLLLFLVAGMWVWFARRATAGPTPAALAAWPLAAFAWADLSKEQQTLVQIGLFFTKAGAMVFGSGLAIVPFLYSGVVKEYGWMNEGQFLDAVAVAMITPGPVVITVGFIGYVVAGLPGAILAAVGTFLPCYLLTILPAPYFKRHGKRPGITAFVDGVTAAAVGAIMGAVWVLGKRTLLVEDGSPLWPKWLICGICLALLWKFKRLPEPVVVVAAGIAGWGLLWAFTPN